MALSYEEALETLQSMFSAPWTRETLDAVLRHKQGHMENTVDFLLRHGEKDPQTIVQQLADGLDPSAAEIDRDAELARQLASGGALAAATTTESSSSSVLPDDFLRVPGQNVPGSQEHSVESDEALARMLQDQLFSSQVARDNPELARQLGGRSTNRAVGHSSQQARPPVASPTQIMSKISELGDTAKKRLTLLAAQFNEARIKHTGGAGSAPGGGVSGGAVGPTGSTNAERRGLLSTDSNDQDDMELMGTSAL